MEMTTTMTNTNNGNKVKLGRPPKKKDNDDDDTTSLVNKNGNVRRVLYLPLDGSPIENLTPISRGYYGYRGDNGRKVVTKHALRVYTEAIYMVKNLINQFETLEASVATLPEAGVFMQRKVEQLKKMLRTIQSEHDVVRDQLDTINDELAAANSLKIKNRKRN